MLTSAVWHERATVCLGSSRSYGVGQCRIAGQICIARPRFPGIWLLSDNNRRPRNLLLSLPRERRGRPLSPSLPSKTAEELRIKPGRCLTCRSASRSRRMGRTRFPRNLRTTRGAWPKLSMLSATPRLPPFCQKPPLRGSGCGRLPSLPSTQNLLDQ